MSIEELESLRQAIKGQIVLPSDPDYDKIRQVFSGEIDKRPKMIVRVADAHDIQQAIAFAQKSQLEVAIRCGGHSASGFGTVDDGLVIDLREMKKLEVNEAEKTAWAEAGLTAGEVTSQLDQYNLAVGFGDTGSVGIGGLTLGGGVGFLARQFGLTIDNLLAVEIVTVDGQILTVDRDNHPDLFWALRGGGGNFGVVTKFKYQLHELQECYGGMLLIPATAETIASCVSLAQKAPNELSGIFNIMPTPPMPFVPAEHHGELAIMALLMYAGKASEGEKVIAPLRALATPFADLVKPMRYKDIFSPDEGSYHPKAVARNLYLKEIDYELAQKIIDQLNASDSPMRVLQLRILGGAVAEVPAEATAYAHRLCPIMANIASFYSTETEKIACQSWAETFLMLLSQGEPDVYVNFLGLHDESGRVKNAYPSQTWDRLVKVKRQYDPTNFFHHNINIIP